MRYLHMLLGQQASLRSEYQGVIQEKVASDNTIVLG